MLSVKMQLVLFVILITLIVSAAPTYKITDMLIGKQIKMPFVSVSGSPTPVGIFVHAVVAGLLMFAYLTTFRV